MDNNTNWNNRANEYEAQADATRKQAVNNARDTYEGTDWPGRTEAKADEARAQGNVVHQQVKNNLDSTGDKLKYDAKNQDADFGDKVKDVAGDVGHGVKEGFEKVKGFFNKDDEEPRVR